MRCRENAKSAYTEYSAGLFCIRLREGHAVSRSVHLIGSNDVLTKASILLRGLTRRCVSGQSAQAPRKHMEKNRTAAAYRLKIHQQDVPYEGDNQQECAETQPGEKKSSLVKRWKSERWQTDGKSFFFLLF